MNFTAWIPIFAIVVFLTLFCLWHVIVNTPRFIPRWAWILLIVFTTPVGGIIYVLVEVFDAGTTRQDAEGREPRSE
ncbi:MAG: PLDc N-terminal domain-containing protein [Acidimicrobiia bacterium]|nr:PLDc N-terminal domain-containing protein [Acidimicrobiia bacterium]